MNAPGKISTVGVYATLTPRRPIDRAPRAGAGKRRYAIMTRVLCGGDVFSCWDDDGVSLFRTRKDADAERADDLEMRRDAMERGNREDVSDDEWVEPVVVLANGDIFAVGLGRRFTAAEIKEMH